MYNARSCLCPFLPPPLSREDSQYIWMVGRVCDPQIPGHAYRKKEKEMSWEGMSLFAASARRHEAPSSVVSLGPAQVRLYLLKPDRPSVNILVRPKARRHWLSPLALAQSLHASGSGAGRPFLMPMSGCSTTPTLSKQPCLLKGQSRNRRSCPY